MVSYEPATIEQVLYERLSTDPTLMFLLAPNNLPPNYQQSIYAHLVPEIDPVSRKQPMAPFLVFTHESASQSDEYGMALNRVLSVCNYRVTVWDTQTGGTSVVYAQSIMQRVCELLDGYIREDVVPGIAFRRDPSDYTYENAAGGKIFVGATASFRVYAH